MRILMRMQLDTEAANRSAKEGTLPRTMGELMEKVKPESAYFGLDGGQRTAFLVFDFPDPSKMPSLVEPLFQRLGAHITVVPVMNWQELQKGLSLLG